MLGLLERLERSCFTLTGAVDAGNSLGFPVGSGEGSRAGVMSGGGRRRSGVLIAKGFIKIVLYFSPYPNLELLRRSPEIK